MAGGQLKETRVEVNETAVDDVIHLGKGNSEIHSKISDPVAGKMLENYHNQSKANTSLINSQHNKSQTKKHDEASQELGSVIESQGTQRQNRSQNDARSVGLNRSNLTESQESYENSTDAEEQGGQKKKSWLSSLIDGIKQMREPGLITLLAGAAALMILGPIAIPLIAGAAGAYLGAAVSKGQNQQNSSPQGNQELGNNLHQHEQIQERDQQPNHEHLLNLKTNQVNSSQLFSPSINNNRAVDDVIHLGKGNSEIHSKISDPVAGKMLENYHNQSKADTNLINSQHNKSQTKEHDEASQELGSVIESQATQHQNRSQNDARSVGLNRSNLIESQESYENSQNERRKGLDENSTDAEGQGGQKKKSWLSSLIDGIKQMREPGLITLMAGAAALMILGPIAIPLIAGAAGAYLGAAMNKGQNQQNSSPQGTGSGSDAPNRQQQEHTPQYQPQQQLEEGLNFKRAPVINKSVSPPLRSKPNENTQISRFL